MSKIAVQMLFGQYEEPFLEYAIKSVDWADYFVACNTAPGTENGKKNEEIFFQQTNGNAVVEALTPKEDLFSFAEARNKTLEHVEEGDYVLIVDSDDVHYPEFEQIVREAIESGVDSLTAHFYHLMVYKDLYQYTQPREILYKKYPTTQWVEGVHEKLVTPRYWPLTVGYHYMHYGYIKDQEEIFKRWKFYSDLVGDHTHYNGQNPAHIVDDRISVSKALYVPHPPAIEEFIRKYPSYPGAPPESKETVPCEKVGLILITYNDAENLPKCLQSLARTQKYPDFEVLALDMGSTDESVQCLMQAQQQLNIEILQAKELLSLTETLNVGLEEFRTRHDIQYIGWIHPDMEFKDSLWLYELWHALEMYPKIGKICAANTRDSIPEDIIPGHEQCYIIRKDIINKIGLFDEKYVGIGGFEDWDLNKRIMNHDGYKVMITPRAKVYHEGMATRSKRDTTPEALENASYYNEKWGTSECPV